MSDPYETTEAHLERLLGRALNSFDLPDQLVERIGTALAHSSALHSSHHSSVTGLHHETYRHTYLLADGEAVSLWELAHRAPGASALRHEVFADKEELGLAVDRLFGEEYDLSAAELASYAALADDDGPEHDLAVLGALFARPTLPRQRRTYAVDDSADHARRVLRRAENADRPGPAVARLLTSAYAHQITQAFGSRQCLSDGRDAGFTLYEHAFVLLDGTECSLWEVEHTATPDGRHMCEVYASERAAREAMEVRARVR
ncbi:DUF6227 family protein [Streptomyces sp. NPDC093225]|uniref:DUF6227 family protein n=1 Tax=Streptomyces sp. NPDC093225 TaxID=3366034 RepID=UPI0038263457